MCRKYLSPARDPSSYGFRFKVGSPLASRAKAYPQWKMSEATRREMKWFFAWVGHGATIGRLNRLLSRRLNERTPMKNIGALIGACSALLLGGALHSSAQSGGDRLPLTSSRPAHFVWSRAAISGGGMNTGVLFANDRGGPPGQENWGVGDAALSDVAFAPSNPQLHVLARSTWKGYSAPYARLYRSLDAGSTWQGFPAPPPSAPAAPGYAQAGGMAKVAISSTDPNRWVYVRPFAAPYYTSNGLGQSIGWKLSQGVPFYARDVFPYGVNLIRLAADAADGMRFYLLNHANGVEVWRSTDGGATWSLPAGARLPDADAFLLAPAKIGGRGELWISLKERGLWRSRDGGDTFERVNEGMVKAAYGVTWGKAAPGSNAPTLFIAGTLVEGGREVDGVFLSTDEGRTFSRMTLPGISFFGGLPLNAMAGDPRRFGRVYIGTGGTGILYEVAQSAPLLAAGMNGLEEGTDSMSVSSSEVLEVGGGSMPPSTSCRGR